MLTCRAAMRGGAAFWPGPAPALEPVHGSTPHRFAAFVRSEVDCWAVIVRDSGAELQ